MPLPKHQTQAPDASWQDIDLSSIIVGDGAVAVVLRIFLGDEVAGTTAGFRTKGNSNSVNRGSTGVIVANIGSISEITVVTDANQVIQGRLHNGAGVAVGGDLTLDAGNITVKGWFL